MTRVLLARHGEHDLLGRRLAGRMPGVSVNAAGAEQSRRLAERLARAELAAVYSSPLERTRETAAIVAARHRLEVRTSDPFLELDFGSWTGLTFAELEADPLWQRFNAFRSSTRAPGGELMLEVQRRTVDELERLRDRHPGETVMVVSHADTIRAALVHALGMPLDLFWRLEVDTGSVSVIELDDRATRVLRVNDTGEPPG